VECSLISAVPTHRIDGLERWMLTQPQAPCHVRHRFAPGLYIREVTIPADTFAVGHFQKTDHMNVMLSGRVTVMREGGGTETLVAPQSFVAPPGRKVGYVHEDMVWLNIYATDETDVETLEALFLDKSDTYLESQKPLALLADGDYGRMLEDLGVTAEQVRAQSENTSDQIPFPQGDYKVKVGRSRIEGQGLIATADIKHGEIICPGRIDGMRTPAGRYINHAKEPNAKMYGHARAIYVVALRDIEGCRGGQDGEEITVNYRQAVAENLLCQV
jgi:SET domain